MGRSLLLLLLLILLSNQALAQIRSIKAENIVFRRFERGQLVLSLKASSLIQGEDQSFSAQNLELNSPKKGLSLKARTGFYDKKKDLYHLKGEVQLKTKRYGEIYTEELFYKISEEVMTAPGRVKVKREGLLIEGTELFYHLSSGEFRLKGQIRAKFSF